MRIAVVVGKEKLGLPVLSIFEFRNTVPKALQSVSDFVDILRGPIESNALVVFRLDRSSSALVQHKIQVVFPKHAEDQLSSLRISELIENSRPSTHKRRLF